MADRRTLSGNDGVGSRSWRRGDDSGVQVSAGDRAVTTRRPVPFDIHEGVLREGPVLRAGTRHARQIGVRKTTFLETLGLSPQ